MNSIYRYNKKKINPIRLKRKSNPLTKNPKIIKEFDNLFPGENNKLFLGRKAFYSIKQYIWWRSKPEYYEQMPERIQRHHPSGRKKQATFVYVISRWSMNCFTGENLVPGEFKQRRRITLLAFQREKVWLIHSRYWVRVERERGARYVTREQKQSNEPFKNRLLFPPLYRFFSVAFRHVDDPSTVLITPFAGAIVSPSSDFLPDHRWLETTFVARRTFLWEFMASLGRSRFLFINLGYTVFKCKMTFFFPQIERIAKILAKIVSILVHINMAKIKCANLKFISISG